MSEACTNNTEREAPQQRGPLTHVLSVDSFDRLLENVLAFYQKAKAAYYATDPNTPALPDAAKKWERASIALISRAEALFRLSGENQELRKQALELITTCAQDASVREMMIAAYTERAVEEKPESADEMDRLNLHYMSSTDRALSTQALYTKRFFSPANYVDPVMEAETRASAVAAGIREAVPEGHYYLPARPYPPERIPEEELVPMTPEPFNRVKNMPVSELVYDEELDEFVVPKGYVSEDEMIDDQSVVWHPENHTVACKFRGEEEPVIWPYWKPADLGDVPKRGSWVADYYRRLFGQWLAEYQFRIF